MREVVLRAPRLSDAAELAHVHTEIWRETYAGLIQEHALDDESRVRREQLWARVLFADPVPSRTVVAELGGALIGFASAGDTHDEHRGVAPARSLQLYAINLLAAHHGAGVGKQLLDRVIGDEPAQLWVATGNARARAFFTRNGFMPDELEWADADLGGLVEARLVR